MGWSLPQDCENKARTLTAVLYRAPAMTLNIHAIVQDTDTFAAQTRTLFVARGTAHWQAYPTTGSQHPVPGQPRAFRQLAEHAPDPTRRAAQSGQLRQLAEMRRTALYQTLAQVPEGCVVSYGELAQLAGLGRAARWVGHACGSCVNATCTGFDGSTGGSSASATSGAASKVRVK